MSHGTAGTVDILDGERMEEVVVDDGRALVGVLCCFLVKKESREDLAVVDFLCGDLLGDLVGVFAMVDAEVVRRLGVRVAVDAMVLGEVSLCLVLLVVYQPFQEKRWTDHFALPHHPAKKSTLYQFLNKK
jgi:hypothetical protein